MIRCRGSRRAQGVQQPRPATCGAVTEPSARAPRRRLPPALDPAGHGLPVQPARVHARRRSFSFTNDASLLLPVNALDDDYVVAVAQRRSTSTPAVRRFYAVTARHGRHTTVTRVTGADRRRSSPAGAGIAANGTGAVMLNAGDVLDRRRRRPASMTDPSDVTGTLVTADKPVQVIGGHYCTLHPARHRLLRSPRGVDVPGARRWRRVPRDRAARSRRCRDGKVEMVRIVATEAEHHAGLRSAAARRADDDRARPATSSSSPTRRRLPDHGEQARPGRAVHARARTPAATPAIRHDARGADEQYRTSYLFHAPTNYESNYVNIIAPTGAAVRSTAPLVARLHADRRHRLLGVARVALAERRQRQPHASPATSRSASACTATATTPATGTRAVSSSRRLTSTSSARAGDYVCSSRRLSSARSLRLARRIAGAMTARTSLREPARLAAVAQRHARAAGAGGSQV